MAVHGLVGETSVDVVLKTVTAAAKELGFEFKTTELVDKDGLPADLTAEISESFGKKAADLVFETPFSDDPKRNYSEVKKVGTDQWLLFRLLEVSEPAELSYEEALDQVRSDIVRETAVKAMEEAAKKERTAFAEA